MLILLLQDVDDNFIENNFEVIEAIILMCFVVLAWLVSNSAIASILKVIIKTKYESIH